MKAITVLEEMVLMAVFRLENDAYGVTIRRKISQMTKKDIIYGTLYNSLDQLVRKGLLKKTRGQPTGQRGGRSKMLYSLTQSGVRALQASRELHTRIWDGIEDIAAHKG